jgi:hypothetical protein
MKNIVFMISEPTFKLVVTIPFTSKISPVRSHQQIHLMQLWLKLSYLLIFPITPNMHKDKILITALLLTKTLPTSTSSTFARRYNGLSVHVW